MFASRFFGARFFGPRYFAKVGAAITEVAHRVLRYGGARARIRR
jgi:hypothetical protein